MDEEIKNLIKVLIEGQIRTDKSVGELAGLMGQSHELLAASNARLEAAHIRTEEAVQRYVEAGDARMRRIEENLDGLIRAIAREHSNGKG